ncbi:MAG: hypothetical protein QXW98_06530 [Candidatus Caldarchaeum sp.]
MIPLKSATINTMLSRMRLSAKQKELLLARVEALCAHSQAQDQHVRERALLLCLWDFFRTHKVRPARRGHRRWVLKRNNLDKEPLFMYHEREKYAV